MRVAVVGSGISGLVCAYLLHPEHDVTVFEAADYVGGHTATVDVTLSGQSYAVDTGFIVFNDWTYPNFIKLLDRWQVASQTTSMSFSVKCERSGLEYNGTNLNTLFAQRRNLLSPGFYQMIRDILRFNREVIEDLDAGQLAPELTLGAYLQQQGYSQRFIDHYIVPMGAAVWSASTQVMMAFPLQFFVRFFRNHGMLSVNNRPQWRTIEGGSREYVKKIQQHLGDRIQLNTPVQAIRRTPEQAWVTTAAGEQAFDQVIIATHSDQALAMLVDPSAEEQAILSALPYQENEVVLHTDTNLLPRKSLAWASWNYHIPTQAQRRVAVTYNMNMLQNLSAPETFCVTLNNTAAIDSSRILRRFTYHHPVFTVEGVEAQQRHAQISGLAQRTHYCGAYWLNGFHEDGVNSALAVLKDFGVRL